MISDPFLQILLSATFILTTAYALFLVVRSRNTADRLSHVAHAVMGAAMFSMVWPWGMAPTLLVAQIVVFALAALWFVYLIATHHRRSRLEPIIDGHHDSRARLGYHGVMMGAMLVMAILMLIPTSGGSDLAGHGMSSGPGTTGPIENAAIGAPQAWINVIAITSAIGFGVAALYFLGSTLASLTAPDRSTRQARFRSADAGWNLLMAAGMLVLFLPLVSFVAGAPHH